MSILTIRLPKDKHQRRKALASDQGVSLCKQYKESSTIVLLHLPGKSYKRKTEYGAGHPYGTGLGF